ncbi:MAG: T9SS type A sorting domain-containing protein [Sphingobacteriales bacterium]|nr:MAG: T9SS type A sorting domain-containing protein [Sphingobacteriales bacterium]
MTHLTPFLHKAYLLICFTIISLTAQAQTYCDPLADCSLDDYIDGFSTSGAIVDISNDNTGCTPSYPSYTYYSSLSVTATQGTSFSFTATNGSYCCDEYFSIWVDWNQDGDFNDAGEDVYASSYGSSSSGETFTDVINVPPNASVGTTRMRVMCSYSGPGDACSVYSGLGEAEDYDFIVVPACETPVNLAVANISSSTADFDWDAVTGAIGYEYVVDMVATAPTAAGTFTATNSASEAGLNATTGYYIHVRTQCTPTDFSNWATESFTTLFNPCPYPSGISFVASSTSAVTFNWLPVSGSAGYLYAIKATPTPPATGTATSATTATFTGLTGGNTYYFFLRNQCSSPTGTSDWTRFQFTMPECYKPGSILVSNVTDTSADFIWGVTSTANYYEYQVDPNMAPPAGGSGFSTTTGMSAHVEGLIPQTQYYVHLRSKCFTNDSSAWILDSLKTAEGCLRPVVVINNAQTNNPSAQWDVVPNAVAYEYKVNNSITPPAFGTEIFNTSTGVLTLAEDAKDYYLHVRAKCNSQFSFSQWVTDPLRISGVNVATVNSNSFGINAYPNPVKGMLTVKIDGAGDAGKLMLTDVTGKIVTKIDIKKSTSVTVVDVNMLTPGIYMLKYADSKNVGVMKVTKE